MNDRARVPFALVGVLLVVSSVGLTATVGTHAPADRPAVDRAMDGATAETAGVLRTASDRAATEAAASPVLEPANTTAGAALNGSQPFRDALRLRVYLAAKAGLEDVEVRRGDVVATASLPAVNDTTEGYRAAIERVGVERAGENGTAMRVEIRNVTVAATRGGRTVANETHAPSFVVANPALFLHDRTARFEARASAPVSQPGLGRGLTARLYPIAWARGYAQYGGAPISTVLGTRHVELATNDALLAEQRAAFGTTDPGGERGVAAAARRVATEDALSAGGKDEWTDHVLEGADELGPNPPDHRPVGTWREPPDSTAVTVDLEPTADRAFASFLGIQGADGLEGAIERAHTAEARLAADVDGWVVSRQSGSRPPPGWRLTDTEVRHEVETEAIDRRPPDSDGWSTREGASFRVWETRTRTRTWERGNATRRATDVLERGYEVRLGVQVRALRIDGVPASDVDGPLAPAADEAVAAVLADVDSFAAAAEDAALGKPLPNATASMESRVDREAVEADVERVHDAVRTESVTVPGPAVGTGRANPPALLREQVADRRGAFRDDRRQASLRERSKAAARMGYLDAVDARLAARAAQQNETNEAITGGVAEHMDPARLDGALAGHRAAVRPPAVTYRDPAGNLTLAVDGGPSYLPTTEVRRDRVDARGGGTVHPLATRNLNLFASPHGHAAEELFDRAPGGRPRRVDLATAAEALSAPADDPLERRQRETLEAETETAVEYVEGELVATLVDAGVAEHRAEAAVETDGDLADRAFVLANGSVVDRALAALPADAGEESTDRLRLRLETTLDAARESRRARPTRPETAGITVDARETFRDRLQDTFEDGLHARVGDLKKRALGPRMGAVAGLPLLPVYGYWYATTNVWYVETAGTYERFAVRADRGGPAGSTTYLRDGRAVGLEHDGQRRRLGTATRVSFRTETVVVVVVPPGGQGVGDTDGVVDERSPGWPPEE